MDTKFGSSEVILGVDTHLDLHVGVVIDTVGKVLATLAVPTRKEGYLLRISDDRDGPFRSNVIGRFGGT